MGTQSQSAGNRAHRHGDYLPALDGLRFMAAMLVAGGHYTTMFGGRTLSETLASFTGLGMTLFFVLSGFVIHYNYSTTIPMPGGVRLFFVARFARLYPLYLALFVFDFAFTGLTARSACGQADMPGGNFFGLIFYLTFTQSWFYAVICKSSLIYQYGPVSAVLWSISVEAFFYLAYVAVAVLIARCKVLPRAVVGFAAAAYVLVVVYLLLCAHYQPEIDRFAGATFGPVAMMDNGYSNSLLRWLFYFNPAARLGEFFCGLAAAHLYLAQRSGAARCKPAQASAITFAAIAAVLAAHLWLYTVVAPSSSFIGRIASPLYAPLVAIMMYCVVSYVTAWSRFLSLPILVRLGEASYSIYLLHELLPSAYKRLGVDTSDPWLAWIFWAASLLLLAAMSRVSYVQVERPARLAIRNRLAPQLDRNARGL